MSVADPNQISHLVIVDAVTHLVIVDAVTQEVDDVWVTQLRQQ